MTVVICFRKHQAPYVMEREWHPTQRVRTLGNGCIELTFYAGGTFEIVRCILSWGDAAEVLQPKTLRTLVIECLRLAAKIYSLEDSETNCREMKDPKNA